MDDKEELEFLQSGRTRLRSKCTKTCNSAESQMDSLSSHEIKSTIEGLKDLRIKFDKSNDEISRLIWATKNKEALNSEYTRCDEYDCKITNTIQLLEDKLQSSLNEQTGANSLIAQNPGSSLRQGQLKLPLLPLPEYGHADGESLENFITNFETILQKYNLTSFEKYVYLEMQLKGEALMLIKSLYGKNQSYEEAIKLLTKAFASPTTQKFDLLSKMANLNLKYNGNCFTFVSEMRTIIHSIKALRVEIEDVLQFFIWRGMPFDLQSQLINITNNNKPNVNEIEENIFSAIERFQAIQKRKNDFKSNKMTESASNFAASFKVKENAPSSYKPKPCILCSSPDKEADHAISKCVKFSNSRAKIGKLKQLKVCIKCANNNHDSENCQFRFYKNCYHCKGLHFSFLCPNEVKNSQPKQNDSKVAVSAGTISIEATTLNFESIFPTLLPTCSIPMDNGYMLHAIKDSGAQCTIILTGVAEKNCLNVVKNVDIQINGFNASKPYATKVVEVPLLFGSEYHTITAVCVPDINIKLKIEGLHEMVTNFVTRKYELADKTLLDMHDNECIDHINFILGADYGYILNENKAVFPLEAKCNCYETPLGIVLMGNITNILNNISSSFSPHEPNENDIECYEKRSKTMNEEYVPESVPDTFPIDSTTLITLAGTSGKNIDVSPLVPYDVLDSEGNLDDVKLEKVLEDHISNSPIDFLDEKCSNILNYENNDAGEYIDPDVESSISNVLDNIKISDEGRVVVPILWNKRNSQLLGKNLHLCKKILLGNLKKLSNAPDKLNMIDDVFREQLDAGVIEKVENIDEFVQENANCSFMAHMPVFKLDKETSKCRNVFLSNLSEKNSLSLNQTIHPGPNLNKKLSTSIMNLRFDRYLLTYDLVKAFLQIGLDETDSNRLCFLWFANVKENDFRIIAFRSKRVPFGLRCSPALLMLSLYFILMSDSSESDSEKLIHLKKSLYHLFYMDNGSYTSDSTEGIAWAYSKLDGIFNPYGFSIQQIITNDNDVQNLVDRKNDAKTSDSCKMLGMMYHRKNDTLSCANLKLDENACTKRNILRSIAKNYDIFNLNMPLLNRARLFMHLLQCRSDLGWDTKLSPKEISEWKNISKQYNNCPKVSIERSFGNRKDDYKLIAFTDSSGQMYGVVIYMHNLTTGKMSFVLAKNRIINKQQQSKTIPSLELQAIAFGTEVLMDTYKGFCDDSCVLPVNILQLELFTDNSTCLSWIRSYSSTFEKLNDKSVFIRNRLDCIYKLCRQMPVSYGFCSGVLNPSDAVTRPTSFKVMQRTNYLTGVIIDTAENHATPSVIVPNPNLTRIETCSIAAGNQSPTGEPLLDFSKFSKFSSLCLVSYFVHKFINRLKSKIVSKGGRTLYAVLSATELRDASLKSILLQDQSHNYRDIFSYLGNYCNVPIKDIPPLINQLNIFKDKDGILRVKAKFKRWHDDNANFPILLSKSSPITRMITGEIHENLSHGGLYSVLSEFRKMYYVPHCFTVIKQALKACIHCRKLNGRTIELTQNTYRDFRVSPSEIPFRSVFLDYLGPYHVKCNNIKVKVYILCICCLWSRGINLKICMDLTVANFLRALQLHAMEHGISRLILSDSGSQLVAAGNILNEYLNDETTKKYLSENGIKSFEFSHYPKGCNKLGGLVESCVKLVKRLIHGSIRNNVLDYSGFEFIVCKTVHLVNRRPIAFKESLRQVPGTLEQLPSAITPEILIKGHELVSVNLIPSLSTTDDDLSDPDWPPIGSTNSIIEGHAKLQKCRQYLNDIYHSEFLSNLMEQSTNSSQRYRKVNHTALKPGDVVLLKEPLTKPTNYPMAIVTKVQGNDIHEVTTVTVRKGCNREVVTRHVSSVIPLFSTDTAERTENLPIDVEGNTTPQSNLRPTRKAAAQSRNATAELIARHAV